MPYLLFAQKKSQDKGSFEMRLKKIARSSAYYVGKFLYFADKLLVIVFIMKIRVQRRFRSID